MTDRRHREAQRWLHNFLSVIRRIERKGFGRNAEGSCSAARYGFKRSLAAVVAVEDAEGVEAAGGLSDRLTRARQRAVDVGLLTLHDVNRIEEEVLSNGNSD